MKTVINWQKHKNILVIHFVIYIIKKEVILQVLLVKDLILSHIIIKDSPLAISLSYKLEAIHHQLINYHQE